MIFRRAVMCVVFVLLVALSATAGACADGYERFEPRPVGDVLPADMIEGPHYRLAPTVRTFGYLNYFVMLSDYGTFDAASDAMLRRLIRENHAITVLHGITLTDAYAKALAQAALSPIRGLTDLITRPVQTVEAVPYGSFDNV